MGNSIVSSYVFMPPEPPMYDAENPYPVTWLTTKSGKTIPSYFLPAKKATKTTILYSHGNAADIGAMYEFLVLLRECLPVNVFHYEYIGYGLAKKDGNTTFLPNETTTYESAEAAFEYLIKSKDIPKEEIIIFGTSVGSGPSCHLAAKYQGLKGLILECPFLSIMRIVTQTVFARPIDIFCNINKIEKVTFPVLVLHGKRDDVVPFDHGFALYAKIPRQYQYPPVWIDHATHHNIIEEMTVKGYISTLRQFIDYCDNVKNKEVQNQPRRPSISPTKSTFSMDENCI
jgi:pimeloyl-ACP methyl ester carboxylesterase